jgi:hypothetical protein
MFEPSRRAHNSAESHHVLAAHGLADNRKGVLANLIRRDDVVGPIVVPLVDLRVRHKRINVDGVRTLNPDCLQLFVFDLDKFVLPDRVASALVLSIDRLAGLRVDELLLRRLPVFLLIWRKETRSEADAAG